MRPPLIGITTYRKADVRGYSQIGGAEAYVQAVARAGGLPVLVPLGLDADALRAITERLDGILFTGGGDIAPACYGVETDLDLMLVDTDRDRVEFALLETALQNATPFLGVCRGLQVINVALGGTLYVDIAAELPQALPHRFYPDWPRDHLAHSVSVEEGSLLMRVLGAAEARVNSLHHQGVRELGEGLVATAQAPDGMIEALEVPDHPFGLAVQWHPENLQADPAMRNLFRALVNAAQQTT